MIQKSAAPFRVSRIEVLQNRRVRVSFTTDAGRTEAFTTRRFGVGRRKAKAAALAKFVARSGLADAQQMFRDLLRLPADFNGVLFPPLPCDDDATAALPAIV